MPNPIEGPGGTSEKEAHNGRTEVTEAVDAVGAANKLLDRIKQAEYKINEATDLAKRKDQEVQRAGRSWQAIMAAEQAEKAAQQVDQALEFMSRDVGELSVLKQKSGGDQAVDLILATAKVKLTMAHIAKQSADFHSANAGTLIATLSPLERTAEVVQDNTQTTQKLLAQNVKQAEENLQKASDRLEITISGTPQALQARREYELAKQNLEEAKHLAANPAEYAERVAKLEKRQLTPAQKLAKTRKFIEGKTGEDAELIKQRLNVDLAAGKPEEAEAAIKKLQAALGMSEKDQDGIVGKKTFNKLAALAMLEAPKQPLTAEKQRQIANKVQLYMGEINSYFKRAQTNPRKDSTDLTQYKTAMAAIEEKLGELRGYEKQLTQVYKMPSDFYVTTTRFGRIDFVRQRFDVAKAFGGREQEKQYAKMKIDLRDSVLPAAEAAEVSAIGATGL